MSIRTIEEADLSAVGELYAASYPDAEVGTVAEASDDIRASWSGDYGRWSHEGSLVAQADDGALLAAVLTAEEPPWDDVVDPVFVIDLFVDPEHRRTGLGRALVSRALTAYPDRSVGLRVDSANTPALGLYRSIGFEDRPAPVVVEAGRPDRDELLDLYDSVGWSAYTREPESLSAAIEGSSYVVTARQDGALVGLARVISDGASICYLQDVLVRPTARRTGVGRRLVLAALGPYAQVRQKVLLTDDEPGQRAFYESLGYAETRDLGTASLRAFVRFDL